MREINHRDNEPLSYRIFIELSSGGLRFTYSGPDGVSSDFSHPFDETAVQKQADRVLSCLASPEKDFIQEQMRDSAGLLKDELLHPDLSDRLGNLKPRGSYLLLDLDSKVAWIPWELICVGEEKEFLCQRFCIARQLQKTRQELDRVGPRLLEIRSGRGVLIALGDVDGIAFREEQKAIKEELAGFRVENYGNLKVDELIEKLKRDYHILHFVGHGSYVAGEAGQANTGWQCTDQTLTCARIEKLSDEIFPYLIFANACDSARASVRSSEGYIADLYRAFQKKGVPHYIGTIGRVPAEGSISFSRTFYQELARGETIGRSLWLARQHHLNMPGPPTWAYYVHYGYPLSRLVLDRTVVQFPKPPRQSLQEQVSIETSQLPQAPRAIGSLPTSLDVVSSNIQKGQPLDLFDKAKRLYDSEVFDEALKVVHQAEPLWPEYELFYWLQAEILLKLNKVPEALTVLRHAVDLDPEDHTSHEFLACALEKVGKLREALESYDRAYLIGVGHVKSKGKAEQDPAQERAWTAPAVRKPSYYRLFIKSKKELENRLRGACARIYPFLSEDELEAEFEKARQEYKQRPDDKRVQIKLRLGYIYHGRNLRDRGAIDEAIEHFEEFREIADRLDAPGGRAIASRTLGHLYYQKGQTAEALALYEAALGEEDSPYGRIKTYSAMANLLVGEGAFDGAEAAIQSALRVFHTDPNIRILHPQARVQDLHREVATLYWHWGECRLAAKDYDNALECNAKIVEFDPSRESAQSARRLVILWLKGDHERTQQEFDGFPESRQEAILQCFAEWGIPFRRRDSSLAVASRLYER